MRSLLVPLMVLFALLGSACGGAQAVVEGVTQNTPFSVFDPTPNTRPTALGTMVVMAEEQGDRLALVTVNVPDLDALEEGAAVDIEEVGIEIEATEGELEVMQRSDGARVVNTRNPTFFPAQAGTFTLDSREPLAGSFEVELEDGSLSGSFLILD